MSYGSRDTLAINTIKILSAEAVQKANSGHPGAPMGMATMAYVLWSRFLRHDPANPDWPDRDRFILSAGHASMLLYSLLHLTGYDLPLDEIRNFRQWGSLTPGHPEHGLTPGVETTTGPLGQGFANGVGMAVAEKWLSRHFNREGHELVDHHIYAIVSDGDLQEGISSEAASLAGTLGLGKIVYLYDDNKIQIEGSTDMVFQEDVGKRFESYRWHVTGPIDGHDPAAVEAAIEGARKETSRPSLIICRTHIAAGSPGKEDSHKAHGEPLGEDELAATKKNLQWEYDEPFTIPDEVGEWAGETRKKGSSLSEEWQRTLDGYSEAHPDLAAQWTQMISGEPPAGWEKGLESLFSDGGKPMATRAASGKVLNLIAGPIANLVGGSADLAPSTKTIIDGGEHFLPGGNAGRNMHFGVREHAMGAIANGMAYHGGIIPYSATFLVFSDYMRAPIRLAAMMGLHTVYVFTHDSIGVGEDGPTHQPVEHLMALRVIPNLTVIRPADAAETAAAWKMAVVRKKSPTMLALTRQGLPHLSREGGVSAFEGLSRGAYVLRDSGEKPEVILIATGSEVSLAVEAFDLLKDSGIKARVVSFPSWELFREQTPEYREKVLPAAVKARVAVEAGSSQGWQEWTGTEGIVVGLDRFGASAPASTLYREFGLTADRVVEAARSLL